MIVSGMDTRKEQTWSKTDGSAVGRMETTDKKRVSQRPRGGKSAKTGDCTVGERARLKEVHRYRCWSMTGDRFQRTERGAVRHALGE
jgi:hypothetical protein